MENNPQPTELPPRPPEQPSPAAPPPPQAQPQPTTPIPQPQPLTPRPQPVNPPTTEQNIPDGMSSYDYLDTLAASNKKSFGFSRKQLWLIGALLLAVAVFVIAAIIIRSSGPNTTQQSYTILARSQALAEVTKESQKNIKSRELVPLNSSLSTQLTSTHSELAATLTDIGVESKKIPKNITASENNQELLKTLDDARLEGKFDRVYTREMAYHLQKLIVALNSLQSATNNSELKRQAQDLSDNLTPLQKQYADFVEG